MEISLKETCAAQLMVNEDIIKPNDFPVHKYLVPIKVRFQSSTNVSRFMD